MESFHEFLSKICVSPMIHVSWPNLGKSAAAKLPKSHPVLLTRKKPRHCGHFWAPI